MSIDYEAMASDLLDLFIGHRLDSAGNAPGLRETVVALAISSLESNHLEELMRNQLEQLRSPSSDAVPDAYFAHEAAIEDALQRAAAGIRVAMARNGAVVEPRTFERRAARRLADNPRLAIRAELARIPRPETRPEAIRWSLAPAPWSNERDDNDVWPPPGLEQVSSLPFLPGGASALARVEDGPHAGWVQIGMFERHLTPARRYPARPQREVLVGIGLEVTDEEPPAATLPFASSPWHSLIVPWQRLDPTATAATAIQQLATLSSPLVALATGPRELGPRAAGLGRRPYLLAPVLPVAVTLGLEPTPGICGFSLSDIDGPGLACRQWRGHLVHDGNYEPLMPAVEGTDLILRPDLFTRLHDIVGSTRVHAGVTASCHTDEDDGKSSSPTILPPAD